MTEIVLAVEDELSERVARRLAGEAGLAVTACLGKSGVTYLQKRLSAFIQLAKRQNVLLLIDMDRQSRRRPCAPELIRHWLKEQDIPKKLFFRVAVCEIESWLLADHQAMRELFSDGIKLPNSPDLEQDPKKLLLLLARRARRSLREDLVREENGEPRQGLAYNAVLGQWVDNYWSPERAAQKSESLKRAMIRLRNISQ